MRQTKEVRSDQCWAWLQDGNLKRETESLIVVAQNHGIRTNLVKASVDQGRMQGAATAANTAPQKDSY